MENLFSILHKILKIVKKMKGSRKIELICIDPCLAKQNLFYVPSYRQQQKIPISYFQSHIKEIKKQMH